MTGYGTPVSVKFLIIVVGMITTAMISFFSYIQRDLDAREQKRLECSYYKGEWDLQIFKKQDGTFYDDWVCITPEGKKIT